MDVVMFKDEDYPDGCRCGVCGREFQHGDPLVHRSCGDMGGIAWTTPVCPACIDEPLLPDHPANQKHVTMRADGTVDTEVNQ